MTRKQIYLLAGAALAVVLAAGIGISLWMTRPQPQPPYATLIPAAETAAPQETKTPQDDPARPTAQPPKATPTPAAETATPAPQPAARPVTPPPATAVPQPVTPAPPQKLTFPYAIPGTTLVIDEVKSYDGIYLEDGSDTQVTGVAAMLLHNKGTQGVDYVELSLTGSQTNYHFVVSGLPAGGTVAVQAENRAPYVRQDYTAAAADAVLVDGFPMSEGILQLEELEGDMLKVTNLSGADIPCVRVFYKFCMQPENVYVGGITYVAKVENLKAGASVQITPSHYAAGGSKVIMAKIYDTAEE